MNTEKIAKLKKTLSNNLLTADLKPKIEAEIKRLEDLDSKEPRKTSARKPSQIKTPKRTAMSLAKEIRKEGESWNDARARASKMMKEKSHTATKDVETELSKLAEGGYLTDPTFGTFQNQVFADGGGVEDGVYAKGGEIEFKHSNIRIVGSGMDSNGNRVVKVSFPNQRPFSIQSNGTLPKTHTLLRNYDEEKTKFSVKEIESMEDEILDYVENYGSANQKKSLKVYGSWLDKNSYADGGKVQKFKVGDFIKKKGSNLELKVVGVGNDWRSGYDTITIYNDVTNNTTTLVDWSDYEKTNFADGGGVEDVSVIYVDNYPYYLKKMGDSTHFRMSNSKDGVDIVTPSHIGQHRGESYYEDIRSWLKGGANPNEKKYMSNNSYANGGNVNNKYLKGGKMKKQKLKKGDNVVVIGKRWFDRVNGNTYHTAMVLVNGQSLGKSPMTYGYDDQYLETAKGILLEHYDFPTGMTERSPMWQLRDNGVTLTKTVSDGLKRELAKGGGVRKVGNREYPLGRNWTNDHRHIDKSDNLEVNYKRKKNFELGGTMATDLAGHTGGGDAGLNAGMRLNGVSGTNYTGLVGETGAMSSGEMFANGGGVGKNKELISYESFYVKESSNYDKAIDELIPEINKSLKKKGISLITTNKEFDKELDRVYVDDNIMIRIWSTQKTKNGVEFDVSVFKESYELGGGLPSGSEQSYMITEALGNPAQHFAKGGGVRTKNGQTYNYGRVWTKDHNEFDKSSEHEVDYRKNKKLSRGGALGQSAKVQFLSEEYASEDLIDELKSKLKTRKSNIKDNVEDNDVIAFAYTDYGGSTIDKYAIEYFLENHPNNIVVESQSYNGKNAFVFGKPAKEWMEETEDYPLGFEDFESYYYDKENEDFAEGIDYFITDLKRDYSFDEDEVRDSLLEQFSGYFSVTTSGLDYSEDRMIDYLKENELIEENLAKGGGIKRKNGQTYNYGRVWTKDHNEFDKGSDHEVEYRRKKSSFFAKGGAMEKIKYDDVLEVLKEKLEESTEELPRGFDNYDSFTGEEVEKESRDGFIAYTDGGYEVTWFEYMSYFTSTGYTLPTKPLDDEMQRQVDYNYQLAKETFVENYPEIVEELGEENIDYNSLYEAGYESEAEELSEMEMDFDGEDSIMCQIGAYYFNNNNYRGIEGKHTLRLFGVVNLESPYHRRGNLEDSYDIDITFDSISELKEKVDAGLKEIIDWFGGKNYNDSKAEMKIRRMANGGAFAPNVSNGTQFMSNVYAKGGGVGKMSEWSVSITSEDGDTFDWDGFAKNEDDALYKAEKEAGFESVESGITEITDSKGNKIEYAKGGKMAKGGKVSPFKNMMETKTIGNLQLEKKELIVLLVTERKMYLKLLSILN